MPIYLSICSDLDYRQIGLDKGQDFVLGSGLPERAPPATRKEVTSVVQLPIPGRVYSSDPSGLGVPAAITHLALQTDAFKELVNKFAWVLGSTYRVPYGNTSAPARVAAVALARRVVREQGYPSKIALPPPN